MRKRFERSLLSLTLITVLLMGGCSDALLAGLTTGLTEGVTMVISGYIVQLGPKSDNMGGDDMVPDETTDGQG